MRLTSLLIYAIMSLAAVIVFATALLTVLILNPLTHAATSLPHNSAGCSQEALPQLAIGGHLHRYSFHSAAGGGERDYLISIPSTYLNDAPSPLILAFHGKGQDSPTFSAESLFHEPSFNTLNAVVVYPQGTNEQWTGDPTAPPLGKVDDMAFTVDLLNHLETKYCLDTSRIYAAGFSNGGGLTGLLACQPETSRRIAAFAAASGAFYEDSALHGEPLFSDCRPSRGSVPILEFHGLADPVEHYYGKDTPDGPSIPIPEWVRGWAMRNGCAADARNETTRLFNGTERHDFTCGGVEDIVVHYSIPGFGHGWPSTVPLDNDFQRYGPTWFNATKIIMEFFGKHELGSHGGARDVGRDEL